MSLSKGINALAKPSANIGKETSHLADIFVQIDSSKEISQNSIQLYQQIVQNYRLIENEQSKKVVWLKEKSEDFKLASKETSEHFKEYNDSFKAGKITSSNLVKRDLDRVKKHKQLL